MSSRPREASLARAARTLILALVLAAAALLPAAARQGASWPPDPSLIRYPEEIPVPQDEATQLALRRGHDGLRSFQRGRPAWRATIDPHTGSVDRAVGDGIELDESDPLSQHRGLLSGGLNAGGMALVFNQPASRPLAGTSARSLAYDLYKDGLPVLGAGLRLGLSGGKVVMLTTRAVGPVTTSSHPRLGAEDAFEAAASFAGVDREASGLSGSKEPRLAFYPRLEPHGAAEVLKHHLVWTLELKPEAASISEAWVAWVDAHDGEVLAFFPLAREAAGCAPDPNQAHASIRGGVRPNRADDPEVVVNLPLSRANVGGVATTADHNGRFPYRGGTVSGNLTGDFFRIHCDNCVMPADPAATGDASGDLSYGTGGGSGPTPVFGNNLSTPGDRSGFFHVNQTRQLLGKWDNAFFDEIELFTNVDGTCNARSTSYMLEFFPAGGGCRNTAEIRDVVHHELGHTWDRFDGNDILNSGMSEWKGDLLSMLIGGDSCVGESFRISGGPTTACSGVRDIDEKAPGRTDLPLTPAVCPTCATITRTSNPCGAGVHCLGMITGQATIHLLNNLRTGTDYITAAALPGANPGFSAEQSRWLLERLLVAGGAPMETWDPTMAGLSVYDAIALIDDEDANLANGTPHAAYYNAALGHHLIAESPQVADAANCSALSDPLVTATVDRDAATGLPVVQIAWTPVGGATSFDVYRNTRAGDAFLPLVQDVAAGPVDDVGVEVGRTYRYFVAATRKTGCAIVSPGANVATVTIAEPEVRVASSVVSEVPGASDGDGLVEPGERVAVLVNLKETGGMAGATAVSAALTSASEASPVTSAGPIGYGAIPASATVAGPAPFELFIGPSEPCGGRVHLVLSATGSNGCWQDGLDVAVDATAGCAESASAFVEPVPGSLQVTGGGGDGDGIADNCEAIQASYLIRNAGLLPSGPVISSVTTPHPGVTLAPSPSCSAASLAPGASIACPFSFSLGSASSAGLDFLLTADSAANPAPATLLASLGAETQPPAFGTMSFGFDGSLDGWTARSFDFSTARLFAGTQSLHSGSITQPDICGRLTSPGLRVAPMGPATLSFRLWGDIEPFTDKWYDRANVHVVDLATGQHASLVPSAGTPYNASGNERTGLCHLSNQIGWGGFLGGFTLQTFDLTAYAGRRIRIEINYNTDPGDDREGIYVDDLVISGVAADPAAPDLQPDACVVPEVSPPPAAVALEVSRPTASDLRLSWEDLGAGFQYNLYAGSLGSWYSHGAAPVSCAGLGTEISCDGTSCQADEALAGLPAGSLYFLVTSTAYGIEGTSGSASSGVPRDPAQSSCAP